MGSEFGNELSGKKTLVGNDLSGKKTLVVRALYGIKSAGDSFRNHLGDCMRNYGYLSCLEDPDLWFKEETCQSDGAKYYEYLLIYVDD